MDAVFGGYFDGDADISLANVALGHGVGDDDGRGAEGGLGGVDIVIFGWWEADTNAGFDAVVFLVVGTNFGVPVEHVGDVGEVLVNDFFAGGFGGEFGGEEAGDFVDFDFDKGFFDFGGDGEGGKVVGGEEFLWSVCARKFAGGFGNGYFFDAFGNGEWFVW